MTNSPVFSARLRSSGGKGSRKTESMVSRLFLVTVVSARAVARAARQIHTMAAQGCRRFKRLFISIELLRDKHNQGVADAKPLLSALSLPGRRRHTLLPKGH